MCIIIDVYIYISIWIHLQAYMVDHAVHPFRNLDLTAVFAECPSLMRRASPVHADFHETCDFSSQKNREIMGTYTQWKSIPALDISQTFDSPLIFP